MIAGDDRQRARGGTFRTGDGQRDDRLAGVRERTADDAGLRIEREAGGKIFRGERERSIARCRNEEEERPARRAAGDARFVDGRLRGPARRQGRSGIRRQLDDARTLRAALRQHNQRAAPVGAVVLDSAHRRRSLRCLAMDDES